MQYEHYQTEDFLKDDYFIEWVKNPTAEHIAFWENWLSGHPEKVTIVNRARDIIRAVRYKNHYQPSEADLAEVWANINASDGRKGNRSRVLALWPGFTRAAAAVIVLSLATLLAWRYLRPGQPARTEHSVAARTIDFQTAKGEKDSTTLPDGSRVILNADSRISYRSDFGADAREIELRGEAFFEVTPDKDRPFRVTTGKVTTTVVGTSFNIAAYDGDPQMKVAVRTGKVQVASREGIHGESRVMLVPGQMSVVHHADGQLVTAAFDPELEYGWTKSIIVLKNADFQEIKSVLEREYAVTFVVQNGLEVREEFTARFENAPIGKVLDALNYTSRFQYSLSKNKVYVTRKDEK